MRRAVRLIILLSVLDSDSLAQSSDAAATGKIERMDKYLMLKLSQSTDIEKFSVHSERSKIKLSPNANSITALSVNYRFIAFQLSYVAPFLPGNDDQEKRGKTKSGKINLSLNHKNWLNDFSYAKTKGYYLENTADYDALWNESKPYIQFPDLHFTQYQVSSAYKFNRQYSISAIAFQTERQIKSAGSFIPQLRMRYYINDDRSTIRSGGFTQKARNLEFLIGAGYHYTLVFNKSYYVALGLTPSIGYVFSKIFTRGVNETVEGRQRNFIMRFEGRAGLGYNGERFIAGTYLNLAEAAFKQRNTAVTTVNDRTSFALFVGYRLVAPKPLVRLIDLMQSKMEKLEAGRK